MGTLFAEAKDKNVQFERSNALKFTYGSIVRKPSLKLTPDLIETYKKYTLVNNNDIVINCLNLNYDFVTQRVGIVRENRIITSAYIFLFDQEQRK